MGTPRGEEAPRCIGGPLRALPAVVIAMAIVAVALRYDAPGTVDQVTSPARRVNAAFDVRKNAVYVCPTERAGGVAWRWSRVSPIRSNFILI